MGITLKEIAEIAGVHKSTVDKVIHNRPGVSDARRQQIRKLLDEYGYETNPVGKALSYQKKNMKVAVVMPKVDAAQWTKKGTELVRQDFNSFNLEVEYYETLLSEPKEQAACLRKLCREKVSGVVVLPIESEEVTAALKELSDANIPFVNVNSDLETEDRLCFVGQNIEQSGQVAARMFQLFLPQGGKIGIISSNYMKAVKHREHAFRAYLPQITDAISVVEAVDIHEDAESAYQGTLELLQRTEQLDGLYITCGCVADICRAVRDSKFAGKLKVISYERYPEIIQLVQDEEITCTIGSELREQGRLSMRLLFEYLIYDRKPEKDTYYTKNEILIRENIERQ